MPDSERDSKNSGKPVSGLPEVGIRSSMAQKTTVFKERKEGPQSGRKIVSKISGQKRETAEGLGLPPFGESD